MQKLITQFIAAVFSRVSSVNIDSLSAAGGLVGAPLIVFVERYVFDDWYFAAMLALIIAFDTGLGVYNAWQRKQVSSKAFGRLFKKLLIYVGLLVCTHAAAHLEANGKPVTLLSWLDGAVYAAFLVREFLSILEKAGALGVAVPAWLLKRLRDFDENGKFTDNNS